VGGGETGGRRRRGGATRQRWRRLGRRRWAGPERAELSDVEEAEERQGRARRAAGLCVEEDRRRRQRGHVVPITHDGSHVRVTPIENTMPLPLNMLI
jgi:hypothetical protein